MKHEILLLVLLAATGAFLVVAYVTEVPYPIWLVVGGALVGFLPGVPDVTLEPDLVLVLLLPPLLYSAAFFSSVRDLRADAGPISMLAFGLVLVTAVGLAVIGHEIVGLSWEVAFVLGAVLSPTDPVAATAIGKRVGAPPRIVTIVEGESLLNDSTALVVYKFGIAAVVAGGFSLGDAAGAFVVDVVVGVAVGLVIGWAAMHLLHRLDDAPTEIGLTLLIPYLAYLPCEAIGVSAVLAAVSAGLFMGWNAPRILTPPTRIQAYSFWEILVFGINAALFLLLGLELPTVVDEIAGIPTLTLVGYAAAVVGGVVGVRFAWLFGLAAARRVAMRLLGRPVSTPWRALTLVSWNGMRGAVSLATALAIPVALDDGAPFPDRDLVIFLAYVTILATVLGQGLTLPWLIRRLRLAGVGVDRSAALERRARLEALDAALDRAEELRDEPWVPQDVLTRVEQVYTLRRRRVAEELEAPGAGASTALGGLDVGAASRLRSELQDAQRERILELRNTGVINDEIMRRIERDLDLEDVRFGA